MVLIFYACIIHGYSSGLYFHRPVITGWYLRMAYTYFLIFHNYVFYMIDIPYSWYFDYILLFLDIPWLLIIQDMYTLIFCSCIFHIPGILCMYSLIFHYACRPYVYFWYSNYVYSLISHILDTPHCTFLWYIIFCVHLYFMIFHIAYSLIFHVNSIFSDIPYTFWYSINVHCINVFSDIPYSWYSILYVLSLIFHDMPYSIKGASRFNFSSQIFLHPTPLRKLFVPKSL